MSLHLSAPYPHPLGSEWSPLGGWWRVRRQCRPSRSHRVTSSPSGLRCDGPTLPPYDTVLVRGLCVNTGIIQ
jgi:hypothetical protein